MAKKPKWISHRGYSVQADENTREAFDRALEIGFLHLETDLRATTDDHLVLAHDRSLMRVAGRESDVDEMDRDSLEAIVLRGGGHLMFFDEFIDRYAAYNWTFDIKPETGVKVVSLLDKWIRNNNAKPWLESQGRFLFWKPDHEEQMRHVLPNAICYAQQSECWRAGLAAISGMMGLGNLQAGRTYALPARLGPFSLFQKKYVDRYHSRGARVCAFLPSSDAEARQAIYAGFDEVLTNGAVISGP